MTQEQLRELYLKRLKREKQCYIAHETNINSAVLSRFKNGKIDLFPHLFERLEKYLVGTSTANQPE
ncbi:hypothetical protein ACTNEY_05090 [Fusicatenibacter saccharivorans]|uniref:hypothetical protein n=1 Tax=Fusicatenibacter saccharivorans TaxID=1150298 RepID=UPI003F8AC899